MKKILLHTPEGVRDLYNDECEKKLYLQQRIHQVLKKYGYRDIQTPSFEFFDIFSKEKGTVPSNQMYKFFDRDGETLVLRPDMTPAMARCVSKYYMEEDMPIRLCYTGQTFINSAEHQGKLKECTQTGGELYGENKPESDGEILAVVIESLFDCGLKEFQIEVGHAWFINGLFEEAGINEEQEEDLRNLIANKNFFGMEEYLSELSIPDPVKDVFLSLPSLTGSGQMLQQAGKLLKNEKIAGAISRLEKIYHVLSCYGCEKYVTFSLSAMAHRNYYTGMIFAGYTYGTGDAIVTGGRYDNLVKQFGKETPSVGFAINLDRLLTAVLRQKIELPSTSDLMLMVYDKALLKEALKQAKIYRDQGQLVTLMRKNEDLSLDDYKDYAIRNNFREMSYLGEESIREVALS